MTPNPFPCPGRALAAVLALAWGAALTSSSSTFSQVHLTLGTPAASAVWVSWATASNFTSVVQWGTSESAVAAGQGANVTGGAGAVYTHTDSQNADEFPGGKYVSPFLHHVQLAGLPADGSEVFYRVGGRPLDDSTNEFTGPVEWSDTVSSFRTQTAPGGSDSLFVTVVGDLGQTEFSNKTMRQLAALDPAPAFMMLVGDLSYADGKGVRWDKWGKLMQPFLKSLPLVAFPGNHEIEVDESTGEAFVPFRSRFRMPEVAPEVVKAGTVNDWHTYDFNLTYDFGSSFFSFDLGPVHFVCLNTYTQAGDTSVQLDWLDADLTGVDRMATPWVLAFAHGPFYNSNEVHQGEVATDTLHASVEPLLRKHDVAALFAGHVHAYERTHGVYKGARDDCRGTTYVTIGDGGNREGLYDTWQEPPADWVDFRNGSKYGRGDLFVANSTHLRWQWWPSNVLNPHDPQPQDAAWMTNPHTVTACRKTASDTGEGSSSGGGGEHHDERLSPMALSVLIGVVATLGCALSVGVLVCLVVRRRKPREDVQGLFSSSSDWFDWEDEGEGDEGEWAGGTVSRKRSHGYTDASQLPEGLTDANQIELV